MDSLLDTDSNHQFASARRMTALSGCYVSSDTAPPSSVGTGDRSVELAEDEVRMLSALADTLLARLKRSYETHAFVHHLRVDKKRWKAIKKREQLTVYKQKVAEPAEDNDEDAADTVAAALAESTASEDDEGMLLSASQAPAATPTSGSGGFASRLRSKTRAKIDNISISNNNSNSNSNSNNNSNSTSTAQAKAPQLMLTGCMPGRVQDALYGLSSATSLAMKFRSSYCQDAVVDAQVLTTIEGPSVDEPFRFLGLKWALQNHQTSSSTPSTAHFFKKRDVVFLESTGTTTLSSGEVVGFHIVHSVHLNSRARMLSINSHSSSSSVVRAKTSMGHLFRQRGASSGDSVDVFMRGYYDPSGGMLHFLAVNLAAEMLLHSATSFFECAQLKKLSWAAHRNTRQRRATAVFRATQSSVRGASDVGGNMLQEMAAAAQEVDAEEEEAQHGSQSNLSSSVCKICSRRYGKLLQRGGAACTICAQMVCSRCTVVKKLSFTRNDDDSAAQQLAEDLERSGISLNSSQYGGGTTTGSVKSSSSLRVSTQSRVQKEICQKSMNFCTACILSTSKQSAAHVAVEEMLEHQAALATSMNFSGSMHFGSSRGTSAATPRQVLALAAANLQNQQQQQRRRTTRTGSVQYFSTTPRVTYNNSSSNSAATTPAARTPIASLVSHRETSSSKTPRPKAFSTSSTSSSTTSSVILYEEPTISSAVGA